MNLKVYVGIFQIKNRIRKFMAEETAKRYEKSIYLRGEEVVKASLKVSGLGI